MSPTPTTPQVLLKNRFLSFLIWQSTASFLIFLFFFSALPNPPLWSFLPFLSFLLLFSVTLSLIASPYPLIPFTDFRRRLKLYFNFSLFVTASATSGFAAAVSLCWVSSIGRVGLRGFLVGSLFGLHYIFKR